MFRFASNLFKRDSSSTDSIRRIYTTGPIRKEVNPDEERIRLSVPIDTIMSRMPDVNLFEIKTYDDEYKYYIRNHYYVYGKDINNDKLEMMKEIMGDRLHALHQREPELFRDR